MAVILWPRCEFQYFVCFREAAGTIEFLQSGERTVGGPLSEGHLKLSGVDMHRGGRVGTTSREQVENNMDCSDTGPCRTGVTGEGGRRE